VRFDVALNLIWFVFGAFALAGTLRVKLRRDSTTKRASGWLHICGVALIVAALFPYISATDDVLRIQHLNLQQSTDHSRQTGKKAPSDALIRLYEVMDTPVVCVVRQISLTLFFVSLVVIPVLRRVDRSMPFLAGRSPPLSFA
jgi:hypothetical protein